MAVDSFTEDCPNVAAWLATPPRSAVPLDERALGSIGAAVSETGAISARAGHAHEYAAALLKTLAAIHAAPAVHLTDDEVFAQTKALREALYLEIMSYRRAARADLGMGTLDG